MMPTLPHLPIELQEEIFRLAARESNSTAGTLIQVSQWVRRWIEPILYEIVVVKNDNNATSFSYPTHIENRSDKIIDFFAQHGHHVLCLSIDPLKPQQEIVDILKLCPSLKNVMMPVDPSPMIETIQEHLINLERLSWPIDNLHPSMITSKPAYQRLTHLDMVGECLWGVWSTFLTQLPSLTHLALDEMYDDEDPMVLGCLKNCGKLEAVLLISENHRLVEVCQENSKDTRGTEVDERIVIITVRAQSDNWLGGVRGGLDMWSLADRVIEDRRKQRQTERSPEKL
ncbi:hypothetical protein BDN72DRAFT_851832 [Pluteus cervinus]|uniref:Uncharacterized protein n=1 Tax=Pluteus cervinus TaxID=181527 RepID=A0ACD2ZXV5_9AGAR|nr:hypothetical protein BDN72DRAFT_851832 [Pluteus cervinus]